MKTACIIGLGKIGFGYDYPIKKNKFFSHFYGYLNFKKIELIGVSDISNKISNRFLKNKIKFFTCYEIMIKELKPDIVSICTPTHTHAEIITKLAFLNIKNILCEKPISYKLNDLIKIKFLIKKYKINILINYFRTWDKAILNLKNNLVYKSKYEIEIKIHYHKGLIHHGTHYLDLLINWFGQPIKYRNLKIVERINKYDSTINFEMIFCFRNCLIKTYFFGHKVEDPKDLIIIKNQNIVYKIINTRIIKKYSKNKLASLIQTNYNKIIIKVIETMYKVSNYKTFKIENSNFENSIYLIKLTRKLLK